LGKQKLKLKSQRGKEGQAKYLAAVEVFQRPNITLNRELRKPKTIIKLLKLIKLKAGD
jgi:hypothetical protein